MGLKMLMGAQTETIALVDFVAIGPYEAMPPGTLCELPAEEAQRPISTGRAAVATAAPGARVARFTAKDFEPRAALAVFVAGREAGRTMGAQPASAIEQFVHGHAGLS